MVSRSKIVTLDAWMGDDNESWSVSWSDGYGVARWSEQSIRLRFELRDADVFGLQFHEKS